MTKIAIITAMQSEYDAVKSLYTFKGDDRKATAIAHNKHLLLIKSGIGKVNGALAAQYAINEGADIVITTGLAGGIDCTLNQGDVVLADKICYHDVWCGSPNAKGQVQDLPLYFASPMQLVEKISDAEPSFKVGLTVTGDQFLTDVNHLKEIKTDFPKGLAVDMESAAIAQTCYLNQVAFVSLRIISDVVGKPEQEAQYKNFWNNMPHQSATMLDTAIKAIPCEDRPF